MAGAAAAAASSATEITAEGPVLSLINKRLRALRKKLNRITLMEESLSQGKTLNKEQEETLRSKSSVLAGIEELEKLLSPLSQALDQEIQLAVEKNRNSDIQTSGFQSEELGVRVDDEAERDGSPAVSNLLDLLYFGSIFDMGTLIGAHDNLLTRSLERNCCLTYDYVTDDNAAGDPLKESDLDLISMLGGLLISRPLNSTSSHKIALQKCAEHAKLWLANSDQPIEPNSNITYAYLREKLNKIMASEYFTTAPEIKAPVEVVAAAGNYTFHAPVLSPVIPSVGVNVSVEATNEEEYQQQEELSPDSFDEEIYEDENRPIEELHQGGPQRENASEVQVQTETGAGDSKLDQIIDINFEEQFPSRKPYQQNYRGGRRGGRGRTRVYTNGGGRGWRDGSRGGGYQNGHGQFYDQPGRYYQRNSYFRGRGGHGIPPGHYTQAGNVEAAS